jgi:hypothetical protein
MGGRIPKQSSSLSSPRETGGVIEPDERIGTRPLSGLLFI